MATPQPTGFILHPDRSTVPKEPGADVPVYARTTGNGVGAKCTAGTLTAGKVPFSRFDASLWAFLPDGTALIAAEINDGRKACAGRAPASGGRAWYWQSQEDGPAG